MMGAWSNDDTETLSAAAAKWKRTIFAAALLPKSSVSYAGTSVRALLRRVRPKTPSRMAPMVMRDCE